MDHIPVAPKQRSKTLESYDKGVKSLQFEERVTTYGAIAEPAKEAFVL